MLIMDCEYLGIQNVEFKGQNQSKFADLWLSPQTVTQTKEAYAVTHNITVPRDDGNNSYPDWIYVTIYIPTELNPDFTNLWTIAKRVDYLDSNGTAFTIHRPFGVIDGFQFSKILPHRHYINVTNGSLTRPQVENHWIYRRALRNLYGTTMIFGRWFLHGVASFGLANNKHFETKIANIYRVAIDTQVGTASYGSLTLKTFSIGVTTQWGSKNASVLNYTIAARCPIPIYFGFSGFDAKELGVIEYSFELTDLSLKS